MSMQLGQEVLQLIKKINENKDQEEIKYINRSKQVYESNE